MTVYPRWLYAGELAIPEGGVRRDVNHMQMQEPVTLGDEEKTLYPRSR